MVQDSTSPAFKVVIVGGGLVGALASVYFGNRGYQVELYEQRPDLRKDESISAGRSINLALSARGLAALEGAGIDHLIRPSLIPMKGRFLHCVSGSTSTQPYGTFGECINSVDRKLINQHLLTASEAHPHVKLFFEHSLVSCDFDEGTVVFKKKSGELVTVKNANLILGADGAYSKTRQQLMRKVRMDFSQTYIDHAYVELNMPPTESGDFAMDGNHLHIWPRHTFMMIALPNLDKSFTVTLFMPWSQFEAIQTEEQLLAFFETTFPDAIPLIGKQLLVHDYFQNTKGALMTVKCNPYHYKEKAVILGDAAHAMVPFYGQGMNCGFEDVLVLDTLFSKHVGPPHSKLSLAPTPEKLSAILQEYSETRHKDAVAICDLAQANYIEMRSSVTTLGYLVRRKIEGFLHSMFPHWIIPLYTMVSFSRIPYSEVVERHASQTRMLSRFSQVVSTTCVALVGIGAFRILSSLKK